MLAVRRPSAGQQRRTRWPACRRQPELWLLDEPHSSLDADGRADLDTIVVQAAASGATVIIASHGYDRARPLADRVVEVDRRSRGRGAGVRSWLGTVGLIAGRDLRIERRSPVALNE